MSDVEDDSSPYEQGELAPSPDTREQEDDPDSQLSLSPQSREAIDDDEDEDEDVQTSKDKIEDEDGLDIKPPQVQAGRKERKHKHKEERRRDKDRHGQTRDKSDRQANAREKERSSRSGHSSNRESQRSKKQEVRERDPRDTRDNYRESKEKERERRAKEEEKREKSRMERERLERLEREKERERRIREARERKEMERRKRREEERDKTRTQALYRRDREKEKKPVKQSRARSRSWERQFAGDPQRDKKSRHRIKSPEPERIRPRGPHTPEEEYPHAAEDTEEEGEEEEEEEEEEEDHVTSSHEGHVEGSDAHSRESEVSVEEEDSESDSESGSGSNSNIDSDDGHQKDSDMEEEPPNQEAMKDNLRSIFDEESEPESPASSLHESDHQDERMYLQDTPPQSPVELAPDLPPYLPAIQGCRNVEEFHCLNRIEEGTYGVVYRARDKKTDEIVALKRLKMEKEKEGFPITSLREINTLLKAQHMNIVTVREIVVGSNIDKIYLVMDYVEHDLKSLMETMKQPFLVGEVKTLLKQLLNGVEHLHDNWIIHRDLKTSNLLLSHKGILKIGDFGLAREYGSPLKQYTPIVVTLWYRAPELLLGCKEYATAIDMWSVGCIFAEFLMMKALWPGKSEIDELNRIFKDLGTPNEKIWPGVGELPGMKKCTFTDYPYNTIRQKFGSYFTDMGFDLLNRFLTYNPEKRITAEEATIHSYFKESPLPVDPSMFPTWPAKSEQPRKHQNSPKPPSGGNAYNKLMADEDVEKVIASRGFHLTNAAKGASAVGMGFSLKF
ncbi:cyclin-dependent kinase 11B-like [Mizuhopecten yessoensis]|uniref:cyclin-dependent kinase n=1 Tax=Mizuhopecten yessoensis TaxID=6573 RepID=A0A210Q5P7_MIZYE|nr:cyclin-dependent kinase 11B-like [Mizuhopecten yessoensis]OWF44048.1 Cyclin-dependent kinase 11B [Mizuhopecten yessoensis]